MIEEQRIKIFYVYFLGYLIILYILIDIYKKIRYKILLFVTYINYYIANILSIVCSSVEMI